MKNNKFLISAYNLIDKFIIAPVTKLIFMITNLFNKNDKTLEAILYRKNALIFLSLSLSLLLFFIVDNKVISITRSSAEVLTNQPVVAEYNQEEYAIEGIPKVVNVTMIGKSADLYLAKQLPANSIRLDLTDLKEGTHRVSIKYSQNIGDIKYQVDPSVVTVVVYQKQSMMKNLGVDILNQDKLDEKLVVENVDLNKDEVVIKGPQYKLDKVANVKALIDIKEVSDAGVGLTNLAEVPLIAYDKNGKKVNVDIVPSKVSAKLTITSPKKEVPVKVIPSGKVAFGKAISTITTSATNIVVYGNEETLKKINYVPVSIDVSGLNRDKDYNVRVKKPVGVRSLSVRNLKISVSLTTESSKEFNDIYIEYKNLAAGLVVQAASQNDIKIPVIVKGDKNILTKLDSASIRAYVDLKGYTQGSHQVTVKVEGDDSRLVYKAKNKKITLNIVKQ